MVNAFAFDCCIGAPTDEHCVDAQGNLITDIFSSNWKNAPGVGRAVSPDNIHMYWDHPLIYTNDVSESTESFYSFRQPPDISVYGYNQPIKLVVGTLKTPLCNIVAEYRRSHFLWICH